MKHESGKGEKMPANSIFEQTVATNFRAPFLMIKSLLPGMLERQRGVIVNMIAYEGSPMATGYSGTKMALRSMAFTVAREIGNDSGVSSFSFVPGIVDTPLVHDVIVPQSAAVLGKMDPAIAKRVTTELARKKERPTPARSRAGNEV